VTAVARQCGQEDCPFNEAGECLEQVIPVEACPHLIERYDTDTDELDTGEIIDHGQESTSTQTKSNASPRLPGVPIYKGKALERDQVDAVAAERESTVVIVAGDVDSGKTTLIGCSYSAFLKGPVGKWRFAGSRTLLGYDQRVHNHRVSSLNETPLTPHSPLGIDEYYHLDVQSSEDAKRCRLLIHDISGEAYQQAIDSSTGAEQLVMLRRADVIVIMLNGASLLVTWLQGEAVSRLTDLLMAVARAGHLAKQPPIQIVVSRWDQVKKEGAEDSIQKAMEEIRNRIERRLREQELSNLVTIHGVASITHHSGTPPATGYAEIFDFWTTLRPKSLPAPINALPEGGRQASWTSIGRHQTGPDKGEEHA